MTKDSSGERLSDKHHITLVLRLVVDAVGTLTYGEIADLDGMTRGRFAGWEKLAGSVRAALSKHGQRK